jgi:nitrogenase subunit NifH
MKPAGNVVAAVLQLCEQQQAIMRAAAQKMGALHVRDDGIEVIEIGGDVVAIGASDFVLIEAIKSLRDLGYELHAGDIVPIWIKFSNGELPSADDVLIAEIDRQLTGTYRRE